MPQEITDKINEYIYHDNDDFVGLNPFDPDRISVEAIFTSPSNKTKTIYGFYYKDFYRNTDTPDHNNDRWDTIHTDYPWRIRFAPDEIGEWKMSVNITIHYNVTSTYSLDNISFNCDNSSNKGYLEVGKYKRNLRYSGTKESFFAVGENFPDAGNTCWTNVPGSYFEYEHYITELAEAGGNYFRHFMTGGGHPIEWSGASSNEVLTNFNWGGGDYWNPPNKGQANAWELDQLFGLAKTYGLYIHLTLETFENYIQYWSFNPYNSINNSPLDFFQNNNYAWNIYMKKLRYIVARWGYSTNLACYELFNEVDQIPAYGSNSDFQTAVGNWQEIMASYLKQNDANHMVTTSYAGFPGIFDNSYYSNHIDFTSSHLYEGPNPSDVNFDRFNGLKYLRNQFSKPVIVGESGMGYPKAEYCCDVSFHNALWSSAFMGGFGAGLNWNRYPIHSFFPEPYPSPCGIAYNPYPNNVTDYYKQIWALKSFINGCNTDFEANYYFPEMNSDKYLENYTLVQDIGKKALGWVHEYTYYWKRLANQFTCLSEFGANSQGPDNVPSHVKLKVLNLNFDKPRKYNVYLFRTPHDGSPTSIYDIRQADVNLQGEVKLKMGDDFQWHPDYAFQMVKCQGSKEKEEMIYDTLECPIDTTYFTGTYGNDTNGTYSYYWNFGNNQTSTEWHPKVAYNHPGNYMITLIVNDNNGNIDSLSQLTTVLNCDSLYSIRGTLTENPSCGGAPIVGDTLIITYNSIPIDSVSPAITSQNGFFSFKASELARLDTTLLYSINSKSGMEIDNETARTIKEWIDQSPLTLNYSTSVKQEWAVRYNGTDSLNDGATALDLMGNIYITGATYSATTGYDMLTVKYDSSGAQKWAVTYRGNSGGYNDIARAITVDSSGYVYITGQSFTSDYPQISTISYTSNGILRWAQRYQPLNCDGGSGYCITHDHSGNIIVGGISLCSDGGEVFAILKYNINGNLLWSANYTGPASIPIDSLKSITIDDSNNVYASGYSKGVGTNFDMVTVKYNSSGTQQWVDRYNNADNGNDYAFSNSFNKDGNIIVTGYSHRNSGNDEMVTINYSPSGTRNWTSTYNMDAHDYAYHTLCNSAGDIYIGGSSIYNGNSVMLVLKYNSGGSLLWENYSLFGSIFNSKSAALDIADNLYITGTKSDTAGITHIITQRINSDGNIQWTKTFNGSANDDVPTQIKISQNGNVYITGHSYGDSTAYDCITLKYSQCPSTASNLKIISSNNSTSGISMSTNSTSFVNIVPNPNNGNMQIIYKIPENTTGMFDVYNLIGKKLFSYPLYAGKNTFSISRSDLNQGIYFYRATAGNKLIAKDKIVVIK